MDLKTNVTPSPAEGAEPNPELKPVRQGVFSRLLAWIARSQTGEVPCLE